MQRNGNRPLDLVMHLNLQLLTTSSRDSFIYFVSCQIGFSFFPLIMHSKISCRCIKSISALACNTNPIGYTVQVSFWWIDWSETLYGVPLAMLLFLFMPSTVLSSSCLLPHCIISIKQFFYSHFTIKTIENRRHQQQSDGKQC